MCISLFVGSNTWNILPMAAIMSAIHITMVYRSLKFIYDPLINEERAEILTHHFLEKLSEKEKTNENEKEMTPYALGKRESVVWNLKSPFPVDFSINPLFNRLGEAEKTRVLHEMCENVSTSAKEVKETEEFLTTKYWLDMPMGKEKVHLWFSYDATNEDVLEGWLASTYLRWKSSEKDKRTFVESVRFPKENVQEFTRFLAKNGWDTQNLYIEMNRNRIDLCGEEGTTEFSWFP